MSEPPLSILYVDDEPLLLNVTKEYLTMLGFIVDIAESGIQALQKITDISYDAIVSDYQMPGMDGIELLREIRRRNLEIPFILFTGRGREEVVIEAIENGADFYIQKGGKPAPQFSELTHKIKMAVQRRRDARALRESELRFRSLIQNSSDIIRILNIEGIIIFDSPSSSIILGYPEGSLVGTKAFDYIHSEDQDRVRSDFLDVSNRCNTHTPTEYRIRKADGTYLYVESIALNLIGVPGIDGIVTTTHPIQNRKMAEIEIRKMADELSAAYEELTSSEEELRDNYIKLGHHEQALGKSEERFRGMAERSSDLIFILDKGMSPTYVSPSARSIIGYDPEELVGKPPEFAVSTIFSQSGSKFLEGIQATMSGESVDNLEIRINKKDGTPVFVNLIAVPVIYDGILTGAQVSMRDITVIRKTETALKESEERFRRFATNAQDLLYRMSLPDGRYEYLSPALVSLTGYTPEEFYSDPGIFKTLIHPAWQEYFKKQWDKLLKNDVPPIYEYQIIDRSGNTRWFNQRNVLISDENGEPVALEGIVTDVTHQKNTERDLRRTEQRFLATTSNAGSWVWETDPEGIYTYSSPAVEKILGYRPDELVGKVHFYDLLDPSVRKELKTIAMNAFSSHKPFCDFININLHRNGSSVLLKTSGTPVFNEEGIFSGYCGVDEDITKEKEAEIKLVESEEKFRALVEQSLDGTIIIDLTGNILFVNHRIGEIIGHPGVQDMVGSSNIFSFIMPEFRESVICDLERIKVGIDSYVVTYQISTIDKRVIWIECIGKKISYADSPAILLSIHDTTERKKTEDAVRESEQKLGMIFYNSPIALTVVSAIDGFFVDVNDAFLRNTGFSRDTVIGSTSDALGLFPDIAQYHRMISSLREQKAFRGMEVSCRIASGEIRICQFSSTIILMGGRPHILSSIEDITERKQSEMNNQAMVKSMVGTTGQNSLDTITETISVFLGADGVIIGEIQPDHQTIRVLSMIHNGQKISNFSYRLKGTPCEQVLYNGFCLFQDEVYQIFPESKNLTDLLIRGYIGVPLRDSGGRIFGILCIFFTRPIKPSPSVQEILDIIAVKAAADIERTHIEQTLLKNQQMLAEAMDLANLVNWEYDVISDLFTFDDRFYALYGTTAAREGGNFMTAETYAREFVHPGDLYLVAEEVEKAIKTPDPNYVSHVEHRIIRRDGEIRNISVRIRITKDTEGRTIKTYGANQDITERKKSEDAIRRANNQLSLLSGITRHDILNKIAIIYAYLGLAEREYANPALSEYLRIMNSTITDIQSQIEFTRVYEELGIQEPQWIPLDIVLPHSIPSVSVTRTTDLLNIFIFADPMLEKVFFNLLDNSVRHGKWVTEIRVSACKSETELTVVWEDNGVGIADEEKEQIFERGFGKNSGLGMFLVREILSLTEISIRETGIPGKGVRFEIRVPKGMFRYQPQCPQVLGFEEK